MPDGAELRVYLTVEDLQPQFAAYLGTPTRARGYPPFAGQHALIIEIATQPIVSPRVYNPEVPRPLAMLGILADADVGDVSVDDRRRDDRRLGSVGATRAQSAGCRRVPGRQRRAVPGDAVAQTRRPLP